jgi:hypothetical protein
VTTYLIEHAEDWSSSRAYLMPVDSEGSFHHRMIHFPELKLRTSIDIIPHINQG